MNLVLDTPLDMHLHFRDRDMLQTVAPLSARTFAGGVIMPNLVPPVDSLERLHAYRDEVLQGIGGESFQPFMTLFFRDYSREELEAARESLYAVKLYPAGATTNSEAGVKEMKDAEPTLALMEELDIPLLVHGESHGFVMDREAEFLPVYEHIVRTFPKLRLTMEHITTAAAVDFLERHETVTATVTLQHLLITLDDVAGGMLQPHLFCKPIAKRPEDRSALLRAALSAHPRLMFGSDSAPHPRSSKECSGCAAGVFTAPIALQLLAELFEQHDALDNLQAFVGGNARRISRTDPPPKTVRLERVAFTIPEHYAGPGGTCVVPMWAGSETAWRVCGN